MCIYIHTRKWLKWLPTKSLQSFAESSIWPVERDLICTHVYHIYAIFICYVCINRVGSHLMFVSQLMSVNVFLTRSVLQLDLERKLRALLTKEKDKAEEEAALAMGLCTGAFTLPWGRQDVSTLRFSLCQTLGQPNTFLGFLLSWRQKV